MVSGDAVLTLETFEWIHSKQFIDWLKFESRHSSLRNFGMAYTWSLSARAPQTPYGPILVPRGRAPFGQHQESLGTRMHMCPPRLASNIERAERVQELD